MRRPISNAGKLHFDMREFQTAVDDFENALTIDPKSAVAFAESRICTNGVQPSPISKQPSPISIRRSSSTRSWLPPTTAAALPACEPPVNRNWSRADYDKAIELNPRMVEAYNHRGNLYHDLGAAFRNAELERMAIADYDAAIKINPSFPAALFESRTGQIRTARLRRRDSRLHADDESTCRIRRPCITTAPWPIAIGAFRLTTTRI